MKITKKTSFIILSCLCLITAILFILQTKVSTKNPIEGIFLKPDGLNNYLFKKSKKSLEKIPKSFIEKLSKENLYILRDKEYIEWNLADILKWINNRELIIEDGRDEGLLREIIKLAQELQWGDKGRVILDRNFLLVGLELSRSLHLFREYLRAEERVWIESTLKERLFKPYIESWDAFQIRPLKPEGDAGWWLESRSQLIGLGNAVVLYCSLLSEISREEKEEIINRVTQSIKTYIETQEEDGYIDSGMKHWTEEFGHILLSIEILLNRTMGKENLYKDPRIKKLAEFEKKVRVWKEEDNYYHIIFGENRNPSKDFSWMRHLLNKRYGLYKDEDDFFRNLSEKTIKDTPSLAIDILLSGEKSFEWSDPLDFKDEKEIFFPSQGLWIVKIKDGLVFSSLGGSNNKEVIHNDVGSYTLFYKGIPLIGDMGQPLYWFRLPVWNYSSHHPLPSIDNQLQRSGTNSSAKIITKESNPNRSRIVYDITNAYNQERVNQITREIVIENDKKITIKDEMKAKMPLIFETSIITLGSSYIKGNRIINKHPYIDTYIDIGTSLLNDIRFEEHLTAMDKTPYKRIKVRSDKRKEVGTIFYEITWSEGQVSEVLFNDGITEGR